MTSPARRRKMVAEVRETIVVSERRVCQAIEQSRSSQRFVPQLPDRDQPLIEPVVRLAEKYGRYGYRRITALLKNQGWQVNHKQVERIWRLEGLKVPQKQPKRGRLWRIVSRQFFTDMIIFSLSRNWMELSIRKFRNPARLMTTIPVMLPRMATLLAIYSEAPATCASRFLLTRSPSSTCVLIS
jgi:transposase InsO family protein